MCPGRCSPATFLESDNVIPRWDLASEQSARQIPALIAIAIWLWMNKAPLPGDTGGLKSFHLFQPSVLLLALQKFFDRSFYLTWHGCDTHLSGLGMTR